MKLYHRGFDHSKSAPFISHACPTTQISMATSVGHPMRGGGGAGGRGYVRLTESFEDTDWSENGAM